MNAARMDVVEIEGASPSGLGRRALYAVLATGLEKAVALGIALYLARRHLGLADYGRYTFVLGYLNFFQVLPDVSLEAVVVTRLAAIGRDAADLAGRAALVRFLTSLAGAVAGLSLLPVLAGTHDLFWPAMVWSVGLLASAINPYRALLRARLQMGRYLCLLGVQGMIALVLLAVVVRGGGGLAPVLGAVSAAAVCGIGIGRVLAGRGVLLRPDVALGRRLYVAAWPLAGTTLTLVGAQQVLQLLLIRTHGPAEMGLLGGAQKLAEAVNLLPQALMVSVLPALAGAGALDEAARRAGDAARVLALTLLPVAAGLALWAGPVLSVVLGPQFAPGAPTLRVLAATTLLGATGAVLTNLLVATGRQRTLFAVTTVSALVMIAIGLELVPAEGAVGAATASVIAMLLGQIGLIAVPATRPQVAYVLGAVVRPVGLGLAGAAALAALGVGPAPGVAILVVLYPLTLFMTGTVTRADLARWRF